MKKNNIKLALLLSLTFFFSGFTAIYLYNNINLLKDNVVENLRSFSEELKISAFGWTTTEVVSTESTQHSDYPTIVVDGSGNVHIAWYEETNYGGSGTDSDIFYKSWHATTATWTTTEVVSTESTDTSYYPTIAVDDSGNVHIAWEDWTDYGGSGTDGDIFYKSWHATTATWTTTEVVSTESTDTSRYPTIAVDCSGNVHIAWDDFTNYGVSGTGCDIFYKKFSSPPPLNPSIIINNGDASTNSTLVTLTLSADGAVEMCFRDGITGAWTDWEPYTTAKQLHLEGSINNTEYSICVKFQNAVGETSPVCDSILYLAEEGLPLAIIVIIIAAIAGGGLAVSITTILLIRKRRRKVQ